MSKYNKETLEHLILDEGLSYEEIGRSYGVTGCNQKKQLRDVEVAHIQAVSKFSDDTPISLINSITNLIGLCPNHHWEYDNGILNL